MKLPTHAIASINNARSTGYLEAGRSLAQHLESWATERALANLPKAMNHRDQPAGIAAWIQQEFPFLNSMIPARRRRQFAIGVLAAALEGRAFAIALRGFKYAPALAN